MGGFEPHTPAKALLETVRSTQRWLDAHLSGRELPPKAEAMAVTLRRYLEHCRRQVNSSEVSEQNARRWRRKIDDAVHALWEMTRK